MVDDDTAIVNVGTARAYTVHRIIRRFSPIVFPRMHFIYCTGGIFDYEINLSFDSQIGRFEPASRKVKQSNITYLGTRPLSLLVL